MRLGHAHYSGCINHKGVHPSDEASFTSPLDICISDHANFTLVFWFFPIYFVSLHRLSWPMGLDGSKTSMELLRPTKPFVGLAEGKGVYGRYHSAFVKLRKLELRTEVMQRKRLRG